MQQLSRTEPASIINLMRDIKKKLGADFPVMVTMNALENGMEGDGITLQDSAEIARIYENAGADALQVQVYEIYNRACYWLEQYYYPEKRDPLRPASISVTREWGPSTRWQRQPNRRFLSPS